MTRDHEPVNAVDAQLDAAADKLSQTYAGADGPFSEEEIADAVYEAADDLQDAPLQTFVPLLAEHKARTELAHRKHEQDH
jgi:hypothetical protein